MALKPFARIPLTRSPGSSGSSASSGGGGSENGPLGLGRTCTLRVSFAGLLASAIILMIALGWMFAFGVIVGRGYDPEEKLPRLAGLLPRQESGQETPADAAEPDPGILKAEELTFMRDLRLPPTGETAPAEPTPPDAVQSAPAPAPEEAKTPDTTNFEFVFQVAAFKNSSQSDNLRERLEGEGLRTRMTIEKDNKGKPRWYRVQVILRGTEADAEEVTRILHKARLRDARVVSKTAVGTSR